MATLMKMFPPSYPVFGDIEQPNQWGKFSLTCSYNEKELLGSDVWKEIQKIDADYRPRLQPDKYREGRVLLRHNSRQAPEWYGTDRQAKAPPTDLKGYTVHVKAGVTPRSTFMIGVGELKEPEPEPRAKVAARVIDEDDDLPF